MRRLVYITRNYKSIAGGGGKARVDAEDILAGEGAVNLGRKRTFRHNKIADYFLNLAGIVRFIFSVRPGDIVVIQYPVKKYYRLICRVARLRKASTVTLVHDLGSFRRKRLSVPQEIKKLSLSDVVIAPNENTIEWLRLQGFKRPLTPQVAWDFLSPAVPAAAQYRPLSIAFVGTLSHRRNPYLYTLSPEIDLHLYGGGADTPADELPKGVTIHGYGDPDRLIKSAEGRYGLIWYGTSTTDQLGYIGEWIRYCNPHKLALYMRSGKPVIIWKGSGAAKFVEEEGIGLTVDNLADLDKTLAEVSDAQYREMQQNVARVASKMATGHYLRDAVARAVALLPAD